MTSGRERLLVTVLTLTFALACMGLVALMLARVVASLEGAL